MNYMDRFENTEAMKSMPIEQLPEGQYKARITDVEIKQKPDMMQISVEFTVEEGDHAGRKTWFNTNIGEKTSDKAMAYIKGQICSMAGVESTNGNALETLSSAQGNLCEITVTYKPGVKDPSKMYANVYTEKMILPF